MKQHIHSISTAIFLGILMAMFFSFGVASWYAITVSKNDLYAEFDRQRLELTHNIAAEMVDPIHSFSPNNGSLVLGIVIKDPRIAEIDVYDSFNEMDFINIHIPDRMAGNLFTSESPVEKDGEEIGRVKVVFSDSSLTANLNEKKHLIQKIFGFTFLANILVMFTLLYFKVFGPLGRLAAQAQHFQKNDLEHQILWKGKDEMNLVGQSFELARVSMLNLISQLKERNEELKRVSITDRLTTLFNRHWLDDVLIREKIRCDRYGGVFGIILLDVDHFKQVNDTHGHPVGDEVLTEIAKLLQKHSRESDIVGRWGGEEFLIVCPESDRDGVCNLAEHLRATIARHPFPVVQFKTASFGVAVFCRNESVNELMSRVDTALYKAKEGGRNRVEFLPAPADQEQTSH